MVFNYNCLSYILSNLVSCYVLQWTPQTAALCIMYCPLYIVPARLFCCVRVYIASSFLVTCLANCLLKTVNGDFSATLLVGDPLHRGGSGGIRIELVVLEAHI